MCVQNDNVLHCNVELIRLRVDNMIDVSHDVRMTQRFQQIDFGLQRQKHLLRRLLQAALLYRNRVALLVRWKTNHNQQSMATTINAQIERNIVNCQKSDKYGRGRALYLDFVKRFEDDTEATLA
jgi:CDP-diacylglycerol pyrophosphatase